LSGSIPSLVTLTNLVDLDLNTNSFTINSCITIPNITKCNLNPSQFNCACSSISLSCGNICFYNTNSEPQPQTQPQSEPQPQSETQPETEDSSALNPQDKISLSAILPSVMIYLFFSYY